MSLIFRAGSLLAAAAAALCLSLSASAQDRSAQDRSAQDRSATPTGDMHHHDGDHAEWKKAHQERRARFLHDILNIRSDQEPAFQAFLADMKPPAHEHENWAEHKDGAAAPLSTPDRLDRMADRMAKHQAAFQHRAEAIKRFYAVLGPEQKRAFDALHAMRGGMRGEGRHEGGPGGHPGAGGEHEQGEAGAEG